MSAEPIDLDAAQALADAATEGPWEARPSIRGSMFPDEVFAPHDKFGRRVPAECHQPEDAEFIAQARTLMPELISELRIHRYTEGVVWSIATHRSERIKSLESEAESLRAEIALRDQVLELYVPASQYASSQRAIAELRAAREGQRAA